MLGRLFTFRPLLLLFALSTWIAFSCVPIAMGLVNKEIFDALQARLPGMTLVWLFLAYALVVILGRLAATLWFWVHSTFEPSYEGLMRTNLFQWIIDRSGRRGHRSPALTLTGNVRDDVPGYSDLVNEWYRIFGEASFVVIAAVIMIRIDPLVTLLTLLPLAAVVLFTHLMRTRLPALVARARETTVDVTNVIAGSFGAVRTIKVFGAQDRIVSRLSGLNRSRAQAQVNSESAQAWIDAITQATVNASKGLVLVFAAKAMLDGSFTWTGCSTCRADSAGCSASTRRRESPGSGCRTRSTGSPSNSSPGIARSTSRASCPPSLSQTALVWRH
jgi:ATP-binding cassette subfamily B protein